MSMMWMRMPGQTWPGAAMSFLGMWILMMVPMMLPSLAPSLWRYRQAVDSGGERRRCQVTALVVGGYFLVWSGFGMAAFASGIALAAVERKLPDSSRTVPMAIGLLVLIVGALQFTAWKAHHLACCRRASGWDCMPADAGVAWRDGLRLGLHCCCRCAGLTTIQLLIGAMDLRVMAVMATAITAERLAPASLHIERAIGAAVIVAGLFLVARAAAIG
jgi:predicted metal-binding membrane protein